MTEELSSIQTPAGFVQAVWDHPAEHPAAFVVLAHGAGGTLTTPQVARFAVGLASRGIATLRFNFPYAERGRKTPGTPKESIAAFRAVADFVRDRAPRLVLGGKSYGGRMASHLAADGYDADALVFLGYPLHAPATPDKLRDEHLHSVKCPMLFLQGTRDAFARLELIRSVAGALPGATLHEVEAGDHSFAIPGRNNAAVIDELAGVTADWIAALPA